MDARKVLLLTATVAPGKTPTLTLRDPARREAHYLEALARWCEALPADWNVVVAENSGWPASRFLEVGERLGRSVQFLECTDRGSETGKGVGEAGLIDDFAGSEPAQSCQWVFKCTGRLYVRNVVRCLPSLEQGEGVCGSIVPSLAHMDSRFFGASIDLFQEYFTDMGREVREDEGVNLEHVTARRMLAAVAAGHAFRPFEALPYFIGQSASIGLSYNSGGARIKWFLRDRVRRVVTDREILI